MSEKRHPSSESGGSRDGLEPGPRTKKREVSEWRALLRVLKAHNYRIPKMLVLLIASHKAIGKLLFSSWYSSADFAAKKRAIAANINSDLRALDFIGDSSDKPAEMVLALANSIANIVLAANLRHFTKESIIGSVADASYRNSARDTLLLDLHVSFWAFGLYLTVVHKSGTKTTLMKAHHFVGLLYALILRVANCGGHFWSAVAFWSEAPTCLLSVAGLLRMYHELVVNKHSPAAASSVWLKVSNALFAVFVLTFSYIRLVPFTLLMLPFFEAVCKCRTRHSAEANGQSADCIRKRTMHWFSKYAMLAVAPLGAGMGYFWALQCIRRLALEILKGIKDSRHSIN